MVKTRLPLQNLQVLTIRVFIPDLRFVSTHTALVGSGSNRSGVVDDVGGVEKTVLVAPTTPHEDIQHFTPPLNPPMFRDWC